MKAIKITVIKKVNHLDLISKYENKIENPCSLNIGDTFIVKEYDEIPKGMCVSAYISLYPFIMSLLSGGSNIYHSWMKDDKSALVSCNDGFRPVSFLLEVVNI